METPTMQTDPSGLVGGVAALVGAILAALVAFGIDLTADQVAAILGIVATAGPLAVAWTIRRHAWAPASVAATRNLATRTPATFVEDRMDEDRDR